MNRYANLTPSKKISEDFPKITEGFDKVEQEMDENKGVVVDHIGSRGDAHANSTQTEAGFMSSADKTKLNGIDTGAEKNKPAFAQINNVPAADPQDSITVKGGTGITITTNPATKEMTITATGEATPGAHGETHTEHGVDPIPNATPTEGGLMSAADKAKIDGMDGDFNELAGPGRTTETVKGNADAIAAHQAEFTTFKGTTETEIDDLKSSVGDGKSYIAAKITDKGVPTAATDSFVQMGDNVEAIQTGPSGEIISGKLQEAISKNAPVRAKKGNMVNSKMPDPSVLPTTESRTVAFSSDGIYLAVTGTGSTNIYKKNSTEYVHLTSLPVGWRGVAFSNDGIYLAIGLSGSPYIHIYKRSGDTFTKLPDPATLPNGSSRVAFSPDGIHLAICYDSSPYVHIYKRTGDTFTKLSNPATLPTGSAYGVNFSNDGIHLAVAHGTTPFITIYKRSGDTFTKLANPSILPTGQGRGISFTDDNTYMVVGHVNAPNITIYKKSGDTFSKLTDPDISPGNTVEGVSFSSNGSFLAVAILSPSPYYIVLYSRNGDSFTKLATPSTIPPGNTYDVAFSRDDIYLAAGHAISPFVTIYNNLFEYYIYKTNSINELIGSEGAGYLREDGQQNDVREMIVLFK